MDELMQTAGRYIGRLWTDISGARDPEEVADVARALVFTPLKAGLKRARDAISSLEVSTSPGGLGHERTANDAGVVERRNVRVARRAPVSGGDVGRASRFAAEAADAERASTAPAEHDTPAEPEPSPSAGRQKRRRVDADDAEAEDAPLAPASMSPKHPPANLRVRTALGDKTPAGILKENGRPTKRKRRDRPVTTRHHVTFEDEVGNEDLIDDDDESPARARRRVDPGAEPHGGPSSTAVVSLPIRKPLAVILPEPPTLPSRAGRVSLRPHGRAAGRVSLRHPASHHLRASRGVGRTGAGVLASVARPRAIGGWNAGGTTKPAELVDLPADPKPLGAVGGVDTAVPGLPGGLTGFTVPPVATGDGSGAAFTFGGGGGAGGGMKRSKSKKGKGDGDEGLFAGLADFKKTDGYVETPSDGTAKVEADKAAGGDGDKPAAATFSFGAPSLTTGDKKGDKKDDEVKAPAPAFSFGAPAVGDKVDGGDGDENKEKGKEEKEDAAPAFTFGAPAADSSAAAASTTSTPAFTFGASAAGTPAPASAAAPGSTPAFTFGAPAATAVSAPPSAPTSAPSLAPAFTFGAAAAVPSASATAAAASSGAAPSFSFGAAAPAAPAAAGVSIVAPASTPATTFTFGAAAAPVAAAAAPIAAAPFSFGAPAAPAPGVVTLSSGGAVPAPSFSFGGAPPAVAGGGMEMGGGGTPGGRRKVRARRPPR